jgi:hypothetical protein
MLAACAAPAIVRADSLMRIAQPSGWTLSAGNIAIPIAPGKIQLFDGAGTLMAEIDLALQDRKKISDLAGVGPDYYSERYIGTANKAFVVDHALFIDSSGRMAKVDLAQPFLMDGDTIDLRCFIS